jgi:TrmH RNA methyltransferase
MAKTPLSRKPAAHASHRPDSSAEDRVAGLPAVTALFAHDPKRAERLLYDDRMKAQVGEFCRLLGAQRKSHRMVSTDELTKIAGSQLHGGIVAFAKPKPVALFDPAEAALWAKERQPLLLLDGVGNPHNLGAIARTMAFFGMPRLVLSDHAGQAGPSEAATRVSEGGLEWIDLYRAPRFAASLKRLRDSHRVIGTALGAGRPLDEVLKAGDKPLAVILGNEEHGLPPATLAGCDEIATIPGCGRVQSLNVAATAAIIIHALTK